MKSHFNINALEKFIKIPRMAISFSLDEIFISFILSSVYKIVVLIAESFKGIAIKVRQKSPLKL